MMASISDAAAMQAKLHDSQPAGPEADRTSLRMGGNGPEGKAGTAESVRAYLAMMRPRQWVKNALVIAAAGAAGALGHDDVPARVGLACAAFCLLASGIYAINDVRDAPEDRRHPRKRFRPVASGQIAPGAANAFGLALLVVGLAICLAIRPLLAVVGLGYIASSLTYTLVWRHILLLDILAIAAGFVLRAVAGGVAAPVALSRWFLLVVTFAAVFVAAGKRRSELLHARASGRRPRQVLERYSPARLRVLLLASGAGAVFCYCMWAFTVPDGGANPWRPLTAVPFAACILRYGARLRAGDGEAPEDLVLGDRGLIAAGAAWLVLFALSVHAGS